MTKYTVIGHYDSGLRYVEHLEADTPTEAIQQLADLYPDESINVAAVIEGHHMDMMDGDYLDDTAAYRDDEETITCDLCGKCEIEHDAIESGWIPSYWKGDTPVDNPVCDKCVKARCQEIDGDNVLTETE